MFADRKHRVISYHDTWVSVDPVRNCPYRCTYCVLRHSESTGKKPEQVVTPEKCVELLQEYPLFRGTAVPIAIGNETDMLHVNNVEYLIALLTQMGCARIRNPIVLITKAPLAKVDLDRIREIAGLRIMFYLSYSGLGQKYEPNFSDEQLRQNFEIAKSHGFPIVHFWRPLLPENTTPAAIRKMLSFVSRFADASVFTGLKLHPELTSVLTRDGDIPIPSHLENEYGEWLDVETVQKVYSEASQLCPAYPLYRHTSCALACVLNRPNHTATVYRNDICPPSHCPTGQRSMCQASRGIPASSTIAETIALLGRVVEFERNDDRVVIKGTLNQEEFSFLLHRLNCPIAVESVTMQNLYHGSIFHGQKTEVREDVEHGGSRTMR
jgi:DNA repair photolyase